MNIIKNDFNMAPIKQNSEKKNKNKIGLGQTLIQQSVHVNLVYDKQDYMLCFKCELTI